AEHRNAELEELLRRARAFAFVNAGGAAREDHSFEPRPRQCLLGELIGNDFGIDARFANPPRDELGHLRAEIDDENAVQHSERLKYPSRISKVPPARFS